MSKRYPGGLITKTPVTPAPLSASGIWTLDQQLQAQQSGTWPFGGPFTYIEDVFSTWLYTGTGAAQTITNNINLSGSGGLVWTKDRSSATYTHVLQDTNRGAGNNLASSTTNGQVNSPTTITSFNSNGYTLGTAAGLNIASDNFVSWTFREQSKFFDIVTYTGTGSNTTIAHNLGSVPGCIIVKRTDTAANWQVYHRSLANTQYMVLNSTAAVATDATRWNSTTPTSSVFSVGTDTTVNASGGTYVAYLFAHNAGGFGLTGTDNVITCGSYAEGDTVNLGYEPQFLLFKATSLTADWFIIDTMRGMSQTNTAPLLPNKTDAESSYGASYFKPTATGFITVNGFFGATTPVIYIAIRRGPMKVPTVGTDVFTPDVGRTDFVTPQFDSTFPVVDTFFDFVTTTGIISVRDRLRGSTQRLITYTTAAETVSNNPLDYMYGAGDSAVANCIAWMFGRAPNFHDVVCYTGTGVNRTITHNLGVVPELIIVRYRDAISDWDIYSSALANTEYVVLNTTDAKATGATRWNSTTPTSSVFSVGTSTTTNASAGTYVAYLFATLAGVSKVGSYTGNGTTQTINCGFSGGARFVLIKNVSSGGNWYAYDTARGMTTLTDPYVLLNSNAAQVATLGSVTTVATGFALNSAVLAAINTNAASYIFLAVA